jgi:hypothetical protein
MPTIKEQAEHLASRLAQMKAVVEPLGVELRKVATEVEGILDQLEDAQADLTSGPAPKRRKFRRGYDEAMHGVGEPNAGPLSQRIVGGFGDRLARWVDKRRFSTVTIGACLVAVGCIAWFGCVSTTWKITWDKDADTLHRIDMYYVGCTALYSLWTIGVPAWFFLEFFFLYDFNYREFDKFKHLQDLGKGFWLSVAVVLAAIFAVRTHLDFSGHSHAAPGSEHGTIEGRPPARLFAWASDTPANTPLTACAVSPVAFRNKTRLLGHSI